MGKIMKYYKLEQIMGKDKYKLKEKMGQEKIISVGIVLTFSSNHKYKKGFKVKEKPLKYVRNGNTTVSYFNVNLYVFSVKK